MNINVTEKAQEELKKVMDTREEKKPLRIYIAAYG
jgi:Fe-S cluster assembly iron-binding protein IscA